MAQTHLETVLTGFGITGEELKSIMELPEDHKDFKAEDYTGKIRTGVEAALKNDAKFWEGLDENNIGEPLKKKIETQQYGRAASIVKQKFLKTLGMSDADIADLSDDDKAKFETVVAKVSEKFANSKVTDKELQQQLIAERKKFEELEASLPEKESTFKTQLEQQYSSRALGLIALSELSRIEGLTSPAKYVLPALLQELNDTYSFVVNEFEAVPMQKDKPALKVLDGTKELTMTDVITKILTRDGLIKKAAEGKLGPDGKPIKGAVVIENEDGKGLAVSSHIQTMIDANTPKEK